ncbi:MAG: arginine--tRNA ligase [Deltaproteobacteria bacterium]|jgi:arginyl-tRNA synthetase|nr:arginine--tRNA ligase [Deltaproteobacteria bacterium]
MKPTIRQKIEAAVHVVAQEIDPNLNPGELKLDQIVVEEPKEPSHGHLATNAALTLAKALGQKPRNLADRLVEALKDPEGYLLSAEVAGPGFINFRLSVKWWALALAKILEAGSDYGRRPPTGQKVQVEYVSANPTGPLHVGHGRGAALGDSLARILEFTGATVTREYYVNDAGRQMRILGQSVLARLLELKGELSEFPDDHYRGQYIVDLAKDLLADPSLSPPNFATLDQASQVAFLSRYAGQRILADIKKDLLDFKALQESWFFESSLYERGLVDQAIAALRAKGHILEKDGAVWFLSKPFGDDKDRVLIKSDGEKTYLAADVAYHQDKFAKGFDLVVDVWGADHHGYIPRVKAAVEALGYDRNALAVVLIQLVNLCRGGQQVSMSTRAGEFVTLRAVLDEVGPDAARFMFLTRSHDSPLDFDLEVAKAQNRDNPVYYVQYVSARIFSLLDKSPFKPSQDLDLTLLTAPEETDLIRHLVGFPEAVAAAGRRLDPHGLTIWLTATARLFHQYYGRHRLLDEEKESLSRARLALAGAIRQVTAIGLNLLGVTAPEKM